MWKRLLIGLDGSQGSHSAQRIAFDLALRYDAEVEGVFVCDVRLSVPPLPPADILGAPLEVPSPLPGVEAEERKRGEATLARFAEEARAAGVRAVTALESGVPAQVLLARLKGADAVFLGRAARPGEPGSTLRTVAWHSVRPVVIAAGEVRSIRKVLVAYDGSNEAMRAVRVACELSAQGKAGLGYALLTVSNDAAQAESIQGDAATFLQAHGIDAARVVRKGPPAETICRTATELGCDLIVAGSFVQNRLRELLLGSVTTSLIRGCDTPLLIHH